MIGRININTVTTGRIPVLSLSEEEKLVSHLQAMAKYGYGYIRQEVCDIATDYAIQLGKRTKENPFTLNWFNKFIGHIIVEHPNIVGTGSISLLSVGHSFGY